MLTRITKSYSFRIIALVLAFQMFSTSIGFNNLLANGDGGPTQPEVHSFEPVETNQMVDLFTGDFTYNIPLFNLPGPDGGYPINLAYHSGIQMEQEASWVGLGWNINVGTINRQVRNLPDDFGGSNDDKVTITTDMKPDWTVGVNAGFSPELVGFDISWGVNLALYYNNYRGIGYTMGGNFGYKFGKTNGKVAGSLGLNASLDSQKGVSANVTAGIIGVSEAENSKFSTNVSASTGFNSRTGWKKNLDISVNVSRTHNKEYTFVEGENGEMVTASYWARADEQSPMSGGSSISFAQTMVSPNIPNKMKGGNGSVSFATGVNLFGLEGKLNVGAFFNFSKLKFKNTPVVHKGIGYMYYNNSVSDEDHDKRVVDISRENDGLVHKDTRRLSVPHQNYDVYSVTGQGIGNMFRPFRHDRGSNQHPYVKSEFHGGNFGLELPLSVPINMRTGFDVGYNYAHNKVAPWPSANSNDEKVDFSNSRASLTNGVYFQNYGEQTADDLALNYGVSVANDKPVVYQLKPNKGFYHAVDQYTENGTDYINYDIKNSRANRKRRAVGVEAFTNNNILDNTSATELIPEFDIDFYPNVSNNTGYNPQQLIDYATIRSTRTASHVGGYSATNTAGMRYIYGLAAYNNAEKNVVFSMKEDVDMLNESLIESPDLDGNRFKYKHKGTNQYYQATEKSAYAHSYMLTSILGTDYVDYDNIAGPSDNDLGYWVKFNYARAQSNVNWRTPHKGAIYNKGQKMSFKDGTASYNYGNKEVWYMATAETKTHIAEFIVSPRKDAFAPDGEISGGTSNNSTYYKLERIDIYVKGERFPDGQFNPNAKPIKSCHFKYDYSLCQGIPGNDGAADQYLNGEAIQNQGGKLTLKSFYFTYRNNESGKTTPYEFEYNTQVQGTDISYDRDAVDRWGNYQPSTNGSNIDYPYIDPKTEASVMAQRASLWSMKAIHMPSGGKYEIDYESDSYAYVQNEVAMHMVKIASMNNWQESDNGNSPAYDINHGKDDSAEHRRVYFELENKIPTGLSPSEEQNEMYKYIKPGEYMYFKVDINLTKNHDSKETVAGYAKVNNVKVDSTSAVNNMYQWGYVELDFMKENGKQTHFHPFTEVGARHIKYTNPDILYDNPGNADAEKLSKSDVKNAGMSLVTASGDFIRMFRDFTSSLHKNNPAYKRLRQIDVDKSYIRLRTPDKVKYGGGHRVKEIRVYDNWADSFDGSTNENNAVYGTVYEYDIAANDGNVISAGVAAYEPMIGGDENPLRNPVKGWEDKNLLAKTVAQTYTEDPMNESLFPGPRVGYRKVRVMSKNTAEKLANPESLVDSYAGISENEFYTALDYPVIQRNSELEQGKSFQKSKLIIPAIIVNINRVRMAASQGFVIELNDMHGKPKGGKELAVNVIEDEQGNKVINESKVSSVSYEYQDEVYSRTNRAGENLKHRRLINEVDVLTRDVDPNDLTKSQIENSTIGSEVEFISESRYYESKNKSFALGFNLETFGIIPAFIPLPKFGMHTEKTGTVTTNKIKNKTGILKRTIAEERGSMIETENLVFDPMTGQPLLTSVTNAYGDKVYNYSVLARDQYEETGSSSINIGLESIGESTGILSNGIQHFTMNNGQVFFPGDVLLAIPVTSGTPPTNDNSRPRKVVTFNRQEQSNGSPLNDYVLETDVSLSGKYRFVVIKSGRKNMLGTTISSMTTLKNPTINRIGDENCIYSSRKNNLIPMIGIDSVLSISAVELGNIWNKDIRQLPSNLSNWYDNAIYSKGIAGIPSPVRSYAYVDDRVQNETAGQTDVQLTSDGVMNNVKLFNWKHVLLPDIAGCKTKWKKTNQITLKNPSNFDVEAKDILGNYTAKLFGRMGTEPIATAANAKNTEIGFESFEEYSPGVLNVSENSTNNLSFYTSINQTSRVAEDRFDVIRENLTIATNQGKIKANLSEINQYSNFRIRLHIDGLTTANESNPKLEKWLVITPSFTDNDPSDGMIEVYLPNIDDVPNFLYRNWQGELFAQKTIPNYPVSLSNPNVEVVSDRAHTGNNSLRVTQISGSDFLQGRLTLQPGEKYQFSGWFSTPNNLFALKNHDKLFYSDLKIEFFDISGNLVSTKTYQEIDILQGGFIDEWQKFRADFTMPENAHYVSVKLPTGNEVFDNSLPDGGDYDQALFYDDLRIQPYDGGMQTYVYNQENHRLEATLDGNNYATFYFYDDEGRLFLVKRETERGIITVSESRNYIKRNQ